MNQEDLLSSNEFQRLHPIKQEIIKEFLKNKNLKTPDSILPKMMMINKELSKRNLSFTKDETNLLINLMKMNMSPNEKKQVDMIIEMFNHK